ncbi:MAG TPA: hypothetical protein PKD67_06630 [Ignavibacteriaceae bacterium]|nr:hypothetical protein [Ignavibacteriaceae bacterium]
MLSGLLVSGKWLGGNKISARTIGNNMKYFLSFIFAYLVTKAIYWLFNFYPFQEYSFFVGLLIDLSIWIILYCLAVFLFDKLFKSKGVVK